MGGFSFEDLRLAVEAAQVRQRHERDERAALAAQAVHTLVFYLGLPHVGSKHRKAWADTVPPPQEMFEAWTGAGFDEADGSVSRSRANIGDSVERPGFREGQPRTVETILEDLAAWGVDPADREAWKPRAQVELQAYFRAVELKG